MDDVDKQQRPTIYKKRHILHDVNISFVPNKNELKIKLTLFHRVVARRFPRSSLSKKPTIASWKITCKYYFLSTEITFSVALHSGMHDCTCITICRHHSLRRCNWSDEIKQCLRYRQQLRFCLYDYAAAAVHNVQNDRCYTVIRVGTDTEEQQQLHGRI